MVSKGNVPYYMVGTLATFTLLASGVFAAAPYIGFLAPAAALSVGLPFIIGYAVFSVVTIALSYKAISKNKTTSEKDAVVHAQEQRISERNTELFDKQKQLSKEEVDLDYLDLAVSSSEQKQRANSLDYLNIDNVPKQSDHLNIDAAKRYLMSLSEDQDVFHDAESGDEKDTKISSPESQPAEKEETKVSGYFNQVVSTAN